MTVVPKSLFIYIHLQHVINSVSNERDREKENDEERERTLEIHR